MGMQVCPCIAYEAANTPLGTDLRKAAKKPVGMQAATGNRVYHRASGRSAPAANTNKPAAVRAFSFPPAGASKPRVLVGELQPATRHSAVAQSVRAGASYARGRRFKSALRNPVRGPIHQPRPSASRIEPPTPKRPVPTNPGLLAKRGPTHSTLRPEPARWPATGRTFPGARPSGKQARQLAVPPAGPDDAR